MSDRNKLTIKELKNYTFSDGSKPDPVKIFSQNTQGINKGTE